MGAHQKQYILHTKEKYKFDLINDDLRKINNLDNANGLCINPSKSKCLYLSRTKRAFNVPDIIIRGNKIDFVESPYNLIPYSDTYIHNWPLQPFSQDY